MILHPKTLFGLPILATSLFIKPSTALSAAQEYERRMPKMIPLSHSAHPDSRKEASDFLDSAESDTYVKGDYTETEFIIKIMDEQDVVRREKSFPINADEIEEILKNEQEWVEYTKGHPDNVCVHKEDL